MSTYSANITNCDSYWFKRRELDCTFEQEGDGTAFFTFSYADNHLDLHRLLPGKFPQNIAERLIH